MTQRVLLGAVLGAVLVGSVVAACGADEPALKDVAGGSVASAPAPPPPPAANAPDPTAITIPAIDARSDLIKLGLTDDCPTGPAPCLASPPLDEPEQAGWYAGKDPEFSGDEYQPGENGPAVIAGHVDGTGPDGQPGHPGIFARLDELALGDEIIVEREFAPPLTFVVTGIESHPKDSFPTEAVYDPTPGPELRLITCSGDFDRSEGHYEENLIVFARLA